MCVNNINSDKEDLNFNLLTNNDFNNAKHEYIYKNFIITADIINNQLRIMIENKQESNSQIQKYQRLYTQEDLIKINRVFTMFDRVEDSITIIEINDKNCQILLVDNSCVLTIKLDTKELPKNKISDTIIFKIPLLENQNNNSIKVESLRCPMNFQEYSNLINNNLKSLNIGKISSDSTLSLDDNSNIFSILQKLMMKVEELSEENKEIKNRLNVLENNNNELINIIKENRINILLKEKNNSDSPSTNITNSNNISYNNKIIENENQNNLNNIFDINTLSFCAPKDNFNLNDAENENSPNYLTRIHAKYLKEKTKNKIELNRQEFKLNKMDLECKEEKNKLFFNDNIIINDIEKKDEDEDNYLYTNKGDNEIVDDINFFKSNENKKRIDIYDKKKYFNNNYEIKKNIMCVDENEEEEREKDNNILNNREEDDDWSINKSYNMVGVASLPSPRNSSFSSNQNNKKNRKKMEHNSSSNQLNSKKNDINRGTDYFY